MVVGRAGFKLEVYNIILAVIVHDKLSCFFSRLLHLPFSFRTRQLVTQTMSTKPRHWLMKAEPDSRIVKGKDVKVSGPSLLYPWLGLSSIYELRPFVANVTPHL